MSVESPPLRSTAQRNGRFGAVKGGLYTLHSSLVTGLLLFFALSCQRDWKNPYDDANYNTPPTARVRLSHTAGTVDTLFIADASGSFDAEDSLTDLQFRWDWESDGTWDNDWSSAAVDSYRFTDGGVKAVKLAVQDRGGMADTIIVTLGINAAPAARFRVTPRLNNFEYSVTVDAGASTDLEDDSTAFAYRWDFGNGEGWSAWSAVETLAYAYVIADKNSVHRRTVKLEVRDSGGAVGAADSAIVIDFHPGMKLIAGGEFAMGSEFEYDSVANTQAGDGTFSGELPVHQVEVSSFWMDSVEVTQQAYLALMHENPSGFGQAGNYSSLPVERISWYMAVLYCNARSRRDGLDTVYSYTAREETTCSGISAKYYTLQNVVTDFTVSGYRLPTEAEWEYACRGGENGYYYFGNDRDALGGYAWFDGNSGGYTHPVAVKVPNSYGLYDMLGNVSEWCNDWYVAPYYTGAAAVRNPTGPTAAGMFPARVIRGERFSGFALFMRSAFRNGFPPGIIAYTSTDIGFRVVLPVQ